jgi:hypothetical protein
MHMCSYGFFTSLNRINLCDRRGSEKGSQSATFADPYETYITIA